MADVTDALLVGGVVALAAGLVAVVAAVVMYRRGRISRTRAYLRGKAYLGDEEAPGTLRDSLGPSGGVPDREGAGPSGAGSPQTDGWYDNSDKTKKVLDIGSRGYNHGNPEDASVSATDALREGVEGRQGIRFEVTRSVVATGTDRAIAIDCRS